jgi:hypothetical protein
LPELLIRGAIIVNPWLEQTPVIAVRFADEVLSRETSLAVYFGWRGYAGFLNRFHRGESPRSDSGR